MTSEQKLIKYGAIALAVLLIAGIIGTIISIVGIFTGVGDSAVGENKSYTVEGEINSLSVVVGAADFKIVESEAFLVESNLKRLEVEVKGNTLTVCDKTRNKANYNNAQLTIYVPKDIILADVDITTGAGKFTAGKLAAASLSLELGAGQAVIDNLTVTNHANIEGGAGEISILGGSIRNLDLEMGVGALNLSSELLGESELDLGVGEVNITLLGGRDSYTVELNKALGDLRLDGESISSSRVIGNGANFVEINGGIGRIDISFE